MQQSPRYENGSSLQSLAGLVFIVLAVGASAWWWSSALRLDVPSLGEVARVPWLAEPERPVVGYVPDVEPTTGATAEGMAALLAPTAEATAPTAAPHCAPGAQPTFVLGFADLKGQVGAPMGEPLECEHTNPENGDALQQTSTGLAIYRKSTNMPMFTDGWRHWALTPNGLVTWEGEAVDPPAHLLSGGPAAAGERMRVANTDGLGVVLRSRPTVDARLPSGFAEGAEVTVLERQGADWVRVRDASGREGWVPLRYLEPAR